MNTYQQMIVEATKCDPAIAGELEDIMRDDIFHSTLDWMSLREFNKGAREAHEMYLYMQSDEGKEYVKQLEESMLK